MELQMLTFQLTSADYISISVFIYNITLYPCKHTACYLTEVSPQNYQWAHTSFLSYFQLICESKMSGSQQEGKLMVQVGTYTQPSRMGKISVEEKPERNAV